MVHPSLRTLLLPREFLKKRDGVISARIGHPVQYRTLGAFGTDGGATTYLRLRTYSLEGKQRETGGKMIESIVCPIDRAKLEAEVRSLGDSRILVSREGLSVYRALAQEIPMALYEIGRLRETAFRSAGEGTGKAVDLDRYDLYYTHLFLWDEARREIAGSYRLAPVDMTMKRFGPEGLYTNSLFRMKPAFFDRVAEGIELGRSFIHPAYQKQYAPLLLLWRGIGRYLVENPCYRILFGPVTISNQYSAMSRQLMVQYLTLNHYAADMASLVAPKTPFKQARGMERDVKELVRVIENIDDLSSVMADLESDRKELPVLLRQYLRLGGRILGFAVDPSFSHSLDGLILVDLKKTEKRILDRYMGVEGSAIFLHHQGSMEPEQRVA
jgi:putative hemolysin